MSSSSLSESVKVGLLKFANYNIVRQEHLRPVRLRSPTFFLPSPSPQQIRALAIGWLYSLTKAGQKLPLRDVNRPPNSDDHETKVG